MSELSDIIKNWDTSTLEDEDRVYDSKDAINRLIKVIPLLGEDVIQLKTSDDGRIALRINVSGTDSMEEQFLSATGTKTFYLQGGATGNNTGDSLRGILIKETPATGNAYGINNKNELWFLNIQDSKLTTWTKVATTLDIDKTNTLVNNHMNNKSNPHSVTASQVGAMASGTAYTKGEVDAEFSEVVDARNGKSNLKTRLDEEHAQVTAQLTEKVNKDEVANGLTAKGASLYANLPTTGNTVGDYYYCSDGDGTHGAGNYVWNGTAFYFGGTGDQGYNILKDDLGELGIMPIKNLVKVIDKGHYWANTGILIEIAGYDAVTIEVEGGKSYSINKEFNGGDNFNLIEDAAGNVIGKYTSAIVSTTGNGWYITMPANAKYLKLTSTLTTFWDDFIILEGIKDISTYRIGLYPINQISRTESIRKIEMKNGLLVDDEIAKVKNIFADVLSDVLLSSLTTVKQKVFDGITYSYKDGYEYYSKQVNEGETYVINAYNDGSVTNVLYLVDANGYSLFEKSICYGEKIFIPTNCTMVINRAYTAPVPKIQLCEFDSDRSIYAPRIIYCGSSRKFKTLKGAIEEATKYMDSIVYVDNGIYDLVTEFGQAYLDAYNGTDNIGILLKNRVRVVFSSGAKVIFNYTGTNANTQMYFSPFNAGENGFALENAYVESKNCRYSVHDERAHFTDSYHNVYKRCTFIHDSSNASGWHASQAIGGGLGKYGDILIEDCYCKSVSNDDTISFHSTTISEDGNDAKSKIVVKNTYTSGTLCFIPLGNSTEKTPIFVSGCNLRIEPKLVGDAETMEVISWGNTIREP